MFKKVTVNANTGALEYYYITVVKNKYIAICTGAIESKASGTNLFLFSGLPAYEALNNTDMVAACVAYSNKVAIARIKSSEPTKLYFDVTAGGSGNSRYGFNFSYPI